MPLYDFECSECAYYTEIEQPMHAPSEHECPHCGKNSLVKVFINPPAMFVRGEPSTIGQLADRNTANMGRYELEDRKRENGIKTDKEAQQKKETHRKINAMTPEQKLKWIRKGD